MAKIKFTLTEQADIDYVADLPYSWDKLKNTTVVISGGTGFIGSHLIAVLEKRNQKYRDNIHIVSLSRHVPEGEEGVCYLQRDIEKEIDIDGNVDYVIHLASNTHPNQYATDPVGTITTNVLGCNNLLKLAVKKRAKRFLLASSVEIYGNGSFDPMSEGFAGSVDCNSVRAGYNESKRLSESLSQAYSEQFGIDFVIARLARVFGADRKADSKVMAQFLTKAVKGENIVLKSEGKQRYSYCYIIDAVSGILKILLDGCNKEAYNIANDDNGFALGDYAKYIAELAGKQVVFDVGDKQKGASTATSALLDCSKIKALGYSQLYSVLSGIDKSYAILKEIS